MNVVGSKGRGALILLLLALGFFVFIFFITDRPNTTAVIKKRIIKSVYASGYVDCVNMVVVKSEVSGYINRIFVKEGDVITMGQPLASIANETLKESLREIIIRKEFVQSRLEENSDYMKGLKDGIEIKRLNLENLKRVYERRETMLEKGLIAEEVFEQAKRNRQIAQKELNKATEDFNDALGSLKTELKSLASQETAIIKELEKYTITSALNGEVLRKFVDTGDYVNHNILQYNRLFSVGDPNNLETVLAVDEEYIPLIVVGQKVLVNTDAFPGRVFEGRVVLVEKESDRQSRTVEVKADVEYSENVPISVTVEANIILEDREALFIPTEAYTDGEVKTLLNGNILRTPVRIGIKRGEYLEVIHGLEEGQEIVVE